MPRRILAGALTLWAAICLASRAWACPDCPTALLVRDAVCAHGLWSTLAVTLSPFAVFALVVVGLHRMGRPNDTRTGR